MSFHILNVIRICLKQFFPYCISLLHKRLAARNVLLNAELEPKISGFGPEPPQPQNNERDGDTEDKVCLPLSKPENIICFTRKHRERK